MAVLATDLDVEAALGRSLTADESARVDTLLLQASSGVEEHTGYKFPPGSYTVGRKVRFSKVRLPAQVATVTSVTEVDQCDGTETAITDYTLRGSTLYGLCPGFMEVAFTVTADIPDEVIGVVAVMVASTLQSPPVGAQAAQAGPFQMSFVNSSGRVWLSASDKLILRKYRGLRPALDLI